MKDVILCAAIAILLSTNPPSEVQKLPGDEIRLTSEIFKDADSDFYAPPSEYTDEAGTRYELESWNTVALPDERVEKPVQSEVIYNGMEFIDQIPQEAEISFYDEYQAADIISYYPARETVCIKEEWAPGLEIPVTYHDYRSDAYQLGEYLIVPDEDRPKLEGYEAVLLAMAGLPESDYCINDICWDGNPYQDETETWCRDAVATGEKRLCDYKVVYGGTAILSEPGGIQWEAVYHKKREPEKETELKQTVPVPETTAADVEEPDTTWKTWVKFTLAVTVAIGALLVILWLFISVVTLWKKHKAAKK